MLPCGCVWSVGCSYPLLKAVSVPEDGDLLLRLDGCLDKCGVVGGRVHSLLCLPFLPYKGQASQVSAKNEVNIHLCEDYPDVVRDLTIAEESSIALSHPSPHHPQATPRSCSCWCQLSADRVAIGSGPAESSSESDDSELTRRIIFGGTEPIEVEDDRSTSFQHLNRSQLCISLTIDQSNRNTENNRKLQLQGEDTHPPNCCDSFLCSIL